MDEVYVVNKYKLSPEQQKQAVYIGRGSIFGNPFVMDKNNSRDDVCDAYQRYFYKRLENDLEFRESVEKLADKALSESVNLMCFCAPKRCHGDIIKEYINQVLNEKVLIS